MAQQLSDTDLARLRAQGLISNEETAFKEGSVIVVENLITKARRIITSTDGILLEANKKLLNG